MKQQIHKKGISLLNQYLTYNYKRYFSNKIIKNLLKNLVIRILLKEKGYE